MSKFVLLSDEPIKWSREDGGYTLRYVLSNLKVNKVFTIVLQSNEEGDTRKPPIHEIARKLTGKQVQVTIETIEELGSVDSAPSLAINPKSTPN